MKLYYKKDNMLVDVYHFFEDKTALIFRPSIQGWEKVKISNLVPEEYYDPTKAGFMSKTERNKIKERLTLTHAIWTCTDGTDFEDCNKAIEHEITLKQKEDNNNA